MTEISAEAAPEKTSIWKAFTQPAAWTMFFFGFSSGLPFLLVAGTLAYWLRESGIELKSITMIASAGLAYVLKFVWAPLLDHWQLPWLSRLGQRRGWLLLAQIGVGIGLLAMAALTPAQLEPFIFATLAVAFFGATQDIAVDAYRIEIAPPAQQGALVAIYGLGYRIALILAGAIALIISDHIAWSTVYRLMAAAMLIPIVANFMAREPDVFRERARGWKQAMQEGVIAPFVDFFRRYGVLLTIAILLFVLLFKIPEQALVGGIMGPFYLDHGFSKTAIGAITKIYGVWVGITGAFLGAYAILRWGVRRPLLAAIVIGAASNLLNLLLIAFPGNLGALTLVISIENLTQSFLGTAAVAYLSSLVNRKYTATQYALLSSLVNLPGKVLGFFAGGIAERSGYGVYFVITVLAVLPATALFLWMWPRFKPSDASSE